MGFNHTELSITLYQVFTIPLYQVLSVQLYQVLSFPLYQVTSNPLNCVLSFPFNQVFSISLSGVLSSTLSGGVYIPLYQVLSISLYHNYYDVSSIPGYRLFSAQPSGAFSSTWSLLYQVFSFPFNQVLSFPLQTLSGAFLSCLLWHWQLLWFFCSLHADVI